MNKYISYTLLAVTLGWLILFTVGCSKQSVTDFSPYPADQTLVSIVLQAVPADFTTDDNVRVHLNKAEIAVSRIDVSDFDSALSATIRMHTQDEKEGDEAAAGNSEEEAIEDPNVSAPDNRPLVETALKLNKLLDMLVENALGTVALRKGSETGWTMTLSPLGEETGISSIAIEGTVTVDGVTKDLKINIVDTINLEFEASKVTPNLMLALSPADWFKGIQLADLAKAGHIVIDVSNAELYETFKNNFVKSTSIQSAD